MIIVKDMLHKRLFKDWGRLDKSDKRGVITMLYGMQNLPYAKTILINDSLFSRIKVEGKREYYEPIPAPFSHTFFQPVDKIMIDLQPQLYNIGGEHITEDHLDLILEGALFVQEDGKNKVINNSSQGKLINPEYNDILDVKSFPGVIYANHIVIFLKDQKTEYSYVLYNDWYAGYDPIFARAMRYSMGQLPVIVTNLIDWIDQENTYLEHIEGASEKTNRKREKQGKSKIEDYYVCRIKKTLPTDSPQATGTGTQHGHIYDVRGHDRHYKNGRVVRIKPHKRGIKNDRYVPKVYLLEEDKKHAKIDR